MPIENGHKFNGGEILDWIEENRDRIEIVKNAIVSNLLNQRQIIDDNLAKLHMFPKTEATEGVFMTKREYDSLYESNVFPGVTKGSYTRLWGRILINQKIYDSNRNLANTQSDNSYSKQRSEDWLTRNEQWRKIIFLNHENVAESRLSISALKRLVLSEKLTQANQIGPKTQELAQKIIDRQLANS